MYFSDLRLSCSCPESKQRLNLSQRAYDALIHDASVFLPEDAPMTDTGALPSGFLNHIFRCFADSAESSIASTLRSRREEYAQTLSPMAPGPAPDQALALLLDQEKQRLEQALARRLSEKGRAFSFRIDRENLEYLSTDAAQSEAAYYQDNVGSYFKAVLEEYGALPYVRREQLYHRAQLECIHTAIEQKKRLKLTLRNSHLATGQAMYMKPCALLQDADRKYNYLVGMLASSHDSDDFQYASVRLTSIVKCARMEKSGILRAEERREIERRIKASGVPYLSSGIHTQRIRVRLTDAGVRLFHTILHLRPMYVSRHQHDGAWIYEFDCLPWQAEIYFFKFGADARILEPADLAEAFRSKYEAAAAAYRAEIG